LRGICPFWGRIGAGDAGGAEVVVWASAVGMRAFTGDFTPILAVLGGILTTLSYSKTRANPTMNAVTKISSVSFHLIILGLSPYPLFGMLPFSISPCGSVYLRK
jgi:hypothetical protein